MKYFCSLLLILMPVIALAHEVQYEVAPHRAIAINVHFSDDEPLSYQEFEIYSPADPKIPYQKGRTDRNGFLSFVPNIDGSWRVRVIDEDGHGLDTTIEVKPSDTEVTSARSEVLTWFRPAIGVLIISVIFGALYLVVAHRRKKT